MNGPRGLAIAIASMTLSACMGPEVMIATNVASAALKASVEYAEKHKPTPEQAWRRDRAAALEARAREGDARAQYALGQLYQASGSGAARRWICAAAARGFAPAQIQLGHWYDEDRLRGDLWPFIGVRPDDERAYFWYSVAARSGDAGAEVFRERLGRRRLDAGERRAIEERAARWGPGDGACGMLSASVEIGPVEDPHDH